MKRAHNQHGWFNKSERSYVKLMKQYPEVQLFANSYPQKNRFGHLYALESFLKYCKLNPKQLLDLDDKSIKELITKAILDKQAEGKSSQARKLYYTIKRFLERNDRTIAFNDAQKKALLRRVPIKVSIQHIPTKSEIYRAVDAVPKRSDEQKKRAKAIILCLYQSGVRPSCLCTWKYGMFRDKLYPKISEVPLNIKVVSNRLDNVYDVAVDTKLSSYKLPHYFTFLGKEAVIALKEYLDARIQAGWVPKESDNIFVTIGTVSRGKPLTPKHINQIIKTTFSQIGTDKATIWTHLLRKSFRKTMYKSGVDLDIAESLMGHKLAGSRSAYFDNADIDFLKTEYSKANFERLPIKRLENTVSKLEENGKLKDAKLQEANSKIEELEKQLEYFKSPQFTNDVVAKIKTIDFDEFMLKNKPKKVLTKVIKIGDAEAWKRLNAEGYDLVSSDDEHFVMQKEVYE